MDEILTVDTVPRSVRETRREEATPGAGRAKLRLSRGFPVAWPSNITPTNSLDHSSYTRPKEEFRVAHFYLTMPQDGANRGRLRTTNLRGG